MIRQFIDNRAARRNANAWVIRIGKGPLDDDRLAEFVAWLDANDANRSAYQEAARLWSSPLRLLPAEVVELLDEPAGSSGSIAHRLWSYASRLSVGRRALMSGAAMCCLIGLLILYSPADTVHETTSVGESRTITLADASVIDLNTNSEVRIHYTPEVRYIQLVSGEAFFQVEKDAARPFIVQTENATVRAVGTAFNVRADDTRSVVSVLQGVVEVKAQNGLSDDGLTMKETVSSGFNVTYDAQDGISPPVRKDVEVLTAWRQGRVEFSNFQLDAAIREINRYRRKPIVLFDFELANLKISGSFDTKRTDSFLLALRGYPGIRIVESSNEVVVLKTN